MNKVDLKKTDKTYYGAKAGAWQRVSLPPIPYLTVAGQGAPEGEGYAEAMTRLYPVAYGVKFALKSSQQDFVVPPLSTQWWAEDPSAFTEGRREEWHWRAMIRMPEVVTPAHVEAAMATKGVSGVALEVIDEGDCFQRLHIGPYSEEGEVLAELHEKIMPRAGVTFGLPHHEIYLSDPRRVAPEKLKTILRQPVVPA